MLAELMPEGRTTRDSILNNRMCWKTLDKILDGSRVPILGLDYLHDEQLEKEVLVQVHNSTAVCI